MLPLYAARIEDRRGDDLVKIDCAACHLVALLADITPVRRGGSISSTRSTGCESQFAIDSALEGDGFEPSVPGRERVLPFWRRGIRKGRVDERAGPETVST